MGRCRWLAALKTRRSLATCSLFKTLTRELPKCSFRPLKRPGRAHRAISSTGQFVDIYVSATTSDAKHRSVSMVIEVKGCWNEHAQSLEAHAHRDKWSGASLCGCMPEMSAVEMDRDPMFPRGRGDSLDLLEESYRRDRFVAHHTIFLKQRIRNCHRTNAVRSSRVRPATWNPSVERKGES